MLDSTQRGRRPPARTVRLLLHLGLAAVVASSASCCRKFYRKSADEEVAHVLAEKDKDPAWSLQPYHVYPDPRSRFADPTNPDRPPMPPDDPGAYDLSPNPQKPGKAGIRYFEGTGYLDLLAAWDGENRAQNLTSSFTRRQETAEPAGPGAKPPAAEPGPGAAASYGQRTTGDQQPRGFLITLEQAVELGLINSREYQDRREGLYLLALPVTAERFAFAAQFFATEEALRQWTGREAPEGKTNLWRLDTNTGFTKLFPTGALLLFRLANRTVVNLAGTGGRHTISESTMTFDLMQPLLRGGGKAVTLEPLTQVERNLLYGIRDYARFRKLFFVSIAGGGDVGRGATQVIGRGALETTPGFLSPTQGFLPILLIAAQLANERKNVVALERYLDLFREYQAGDVVTQLQVQQVEQQLLDGRSQVLNTELDYRDALDRLKLQMGVPPGVDLELDSSRLQPLVGQFQRYEEVQQQFKSVAGELEAVGRDVLRQEALEEALVATGSFFGVSPLPAGVAQGAALAAAARVYITESTPGLFPSPLRARIEKSVLISELVRGTSLIKRLPGRLAEWGKLSDKQLFERLQQLLEERRALLKLQTQLDLEGKRLSEEHQRRLAELNFEIEVGSLEQALRNYRGRPWRQRTTWQERLEEHNRALELVLREVFRLLARARQERLDELRRTWPELSALRVGGTDLLQTDLAEAQAVVAQTALTYRLDLMNARAQLVDAWRQIAVTANALLGVFNVRYHFDTFSPLGLAMPTNFFGSRYRHQMFLNGELPLVRKLERNDFRAAQIFFQRQRRELMAAEDQALVGVREEIRQLRVLAENYTIQKRLVELAYLQVENAEDTFRAPPPPTGPGQAISSAASAAALTQQLLSAQASLVRAQNQLYQIWISYLTTRLLLYRDLELMPLDFRGVWTDEPANLSANDCPDGQSLPRQRPAPGDPPGQRGDQLPPPRPSPAGP